MTTTQRSPLGLGVGWRPELALALERRSDLGFIELLVEDFDPAKPLPHAVERLLERGVVVIPHGVSLSLGSAEPPEPARLRRLAALAQRVQAPLVSEHLAFVRGGGLESGHLLPVPRTRETLEIVVENIRQARASLPVPLAIENVACLLEWPDNEMSEADFLTEVLERADVGLLLDIENVYANSRNHGGDPLQFLEKIPLARIAYVHIAGGVERRGVYHDTHTHPIPTAVLELLEELSARVLLALSGVLLERDDNFPDVAEFNAELDAIAAAVQRGTRRRECGHVSIS